MDSIQTRDAESILTSYEPQDAAFLQTSGTSELGSSAKYNTGAQDEAAVAHCKIVHKEFWDAGIIGSVSKVCYGQYQGKAACLVVFCFSLRSGNKALRFRNANFKITFEKHPATDPMHADP